MAPKTGARRNPNTGRFARRYDNLSLLAVARAVFLRAVAMTGVEPLLLTLVDYDAAREPAGYPTSPQGFRVVAQLKTTWPKLKATLLLDDAAFAAVVRSFDWRDRTTLDEAVVVKALRAIALRLGVQMLRPDQYDIERDKLVSEDGARWLHGAGLDRDLPTASQIDDQIGWDAALALAGLEQRGGPPTLKGVPAIEVIELFLEELGYLPQSFKTLAKYAAEKRVSLADPEGSRVLTPFFSVLRALRLPRWTPDAPPEPGSPLPPWTVEPLVDSRVAPQNGRGTWTLAGAIGSLITVADELDEVRPGTKLTQANYRKHQVGRRDLASPHTIGAVAKRHGTTFSKLRDQVVRWRAGDRETEPPFLVQAREADEQFAATAAAERKQQLREQSERQEWARELLHLLARERRELKTSEIAAALDWPHSTTQRRLKALSATIAMVNYGKGTKSIRWRMRAWTLSPADQLATALRRRRSSRGASAVRD